MNERITAWLKNHLVNCEYTEFGWQECHRYEFDEDELKEYTKMIVGEVFDRIENESFEVYEPTVKAVKQHFGVEE
jgi:hypothetical protein